MRKLTIEELNRLDAAEFRAASKMPLVIILDNIRSLHNVGSVLRTADAFRLEAVYLCGITATPPSPEIHKTALGAEDSVAWHYEADTLTCVHQLQEQGYHVVAVEQVEGSSKMGEWQIPDLSEATSASTTTTEAAHKPCAGLALILGNEVKGVQQSVVDAANEALEIPQYGTKHSMNVSVTAGIVIWEAIRQMQQYIRLAIIALALLIALPYQAEAAPCESAPSAQADNDTLPDLAMPLTVQVGRAAYKGDSIPEVILPTLHKFPEETFASAKKREEYNRLVRNVKKMLPIAKTARYTLLETYDYIQTLPTEKERKEHLKLVENGLKRQYAPLLRKTTKAQGRILIKLIDRECGQTGLAIAKAFIGELKANLYQGVAFIFGHNLNKHYDPKGEDAEIERIILKVESGQL